MYGYELFYETGGHTGPLWTLSHAMNTARRLLLGIPSCPAIHIKERDGVSPGGFGKTVVTMRRNGAWVGESGRE